MALRDQPYLPLYIQDYLTDEKLNECSASAQGVYIKIMCILHKQETYGSILFKQKDKQKPSNIENFALKFAKLLPFTYEIILSALDELVEEKVLTIEGDKLYQKRMVKDGNISEVRSKAGKNGGGNPNLFKQKPKQKRKQRVKQNTEIDIESESEDVIVNGDEEIRKIVYPFNTENFIRYWNIWKEYKHREHKFKYKTELSEQSALKELSTLANTEEHAIKIIEQSMAHGWAGLFPIKSQGNGTANHNGNPNNRITQADRDKLARDLQAAINKGIEAESQ